MNNTSLILYIVIQLHIQSLHFFSSCTIFSNPNKTSPLFALTYILALPKSLCSYFLPHRTFLHGQMLFFLFKTPTKSLQACHPALQATTEPLEQNPKTSYTVIKLFCMFPSYRPSPFKSMVVFKVSTRFVTGQISPVQTSAMHKCISVLINESHTDISHGQSPKHSCFLVHCKKASEAMHKTTLSSPHLSKHISSVRELAPGALAFALHCSHHQLSPPPWLSTLCSSTPVILSICITLKNCIGFH